MERYTIEKDIAVMCLTASSFPDGVLAAHQQLHQLVPPGNGRRYYGLSRPEGGTIVYKAAAEELRQNEAQDNGCESMVIKAGSYMGMDIKNFMTDIPAIGNAFQQILQEPGLAPNGYCVEWYNDNDVRCMVRLNEQ